MSESFGIKVSLPGYNVNDATPEQCSVHSGYDTHKINDHASPAHYGVVSLTVSNEPANPSTTNIMSFNHNYPYRPVCMAHFRDPARSAGQFAVTGIFGLDAFISSYIKVYTTDTQFRIDLVKGGPVTLAGRVFTIRYYIFAEDGN